MSKKRIALLVAGIVFLAIVVALFLLLFPRSSISADQVAECLANDGSFAFDEFSHPDIYRGGVYAFSFKDIQGLQFKRDSDSLSVVFECNLEGQAYKTTEKVSVEASIVLSNNTLTFISAQLAGNQLPPLQPTIPFDPWLLLDDDTGLSFFVLQATYDPERHLLPGASLAAGLFFGDGGRGVIVRFRLCDIKDVVSSIAVSNPTGEANMRDRHIQIDLKSGSKIHVTNPVVYEGGASVFDRSPSPKWTIYWQVKVPSPYAGVGMVVEYED